MVKHKSVLYLGFDVQHFKSNKTVIHMPLVSIVPRPIDSIEIRRIFSEILNFTHIVFTSKNSVKLFFSYLKQFGYGVSVLNRKYIISVGQVPAHYLREAGVCVNYIASDETQEGIITMLSHLDLDKANILLPRSSSARPLLSHYLVEHGIRHQICTLYDMCKKKPLEVPDLRDVDEVVFTTTIAVDVFFEIYKYVPKHVRLHPIGPMVVERLRRALHTHRESFPMNGREKSVAFAC